MMESSPKTCNDEPRAIDIAALILLADLLYVAPEFGFATEHIHAAQDLLKNAPDAVLAYIQACNNLSVALPDS